jgi:predicted nucleotide-binding protein
VKLPIVFIASSSEGLEVAKAVRALLLHELQDEARITLWTREFYLSATYIESLEKASQEADFAVLVVTPDDITISRDKKKSAPRDNVVFELGLFMGCLGRDRCLIVDEERPDLKLPSDLLGVHRATFSQSARQELRDALEVPCLLIAERIAKLGATVMQLKIPGFCGRITGTPDL